MTRHGLLCLFLLLLGGASLFAQPAANGTLNFDSGADGATATTTNTGFGGIRIGSGGGTITIQNPGTAVGSGGEVKAIAPTGGSINAFGITSTEYGTAATTFTLAFDIMFTGGSSGTWYLFTGNGATFAAAQSSTFTGSQTFTGLRFVYGASSAITTSNRAAAAWVAVSGTPFAQNVNYTVKVIGNNSASTVTYATGLSVATGTFDVFVNDVLVGDDLPKAQLATSTTINAFRFYGESSTGNVATINLDNVKWWNTCVDPALILPVEIKAFSATTSNNDVKLKWTTATELNSLGYYVERANKRESNIEFTNLGFVQGEGTSNKPKNYSFIDYNVSGGKYLYRLKQVDKDGVFEYSKTIEVDVEQPVSYSLSQNYPNPFNPSTSVVYSLPKAGAVTLSLYNTLGEKVKDIVRETKDAGIYKVNISASELNSGIYYYTLNVASQDGKENYTNTKKLVVLK